MNFSPSNNNNLTVLLAVDNPDISLANGYILQFGENGSDDAIELLSLEDGNPTLIGRGTDGKISASFDLSIRLEKNTNDLWTLLCGSSDAGTVLDIQFENNFDDQAITQMSIFGFICQYTSSNIDNFIFDNISINEIRPDTDAPNVILVNVLNNTQIEVIFNEPINADSAKEINNYTISNSSIQDILFDEANSNIVILNLTTALNSCEQSDLTIINVTDLANNPLNEYQTNLSIVDEPQFGDILINEILADPITGEFDFVEFVNPTEKTISLEGLIIKNIDKNEEATITQNIILAPGEIIAFSEGAAELKSIYNTPNDARIESQDLPSFNVSSGNVSLIQESILGDLIIDGFDYQNAYHDPAVSPTKGTSLERVQFITNTNSSSNWSSSDQNLRATPGHKNSISEVNIIQSAAQLISEDQIIINFLNSLNPSEALDVSNYILNNGAVVMDIELNPDNEKSVILFLQNPLESGTTYTLNISNLSSDCGQTIEANTFELFRIDIPEKGDLLINEILFDGDEEGDDFAEIINTTNKYISLKNVSLRNSTRNDNDILINSIDYIEPNQIIAFTEDKNSVIEQYDPPARANILIQKVPVLNRDEGNISLIYTEFFEVVIDAFDYSEDFHFQAISDTKSVSLERISTISDSQDPSNWNSSAGDNNFATPGYENSVRSELQTPNEEVITLESKVFSPDGDGFKDVLLINYFFDKPGYIGKIEIYDDRGREEFILLENQLLGINGIIKWDGTLNNSTVAPIGIYILNYEFFHPDGDIVTGKKVCVLAQQLN